MKMSNHADKTWGHHAARLQPSMQQHRGARKTQHSMHTMVRHSRVSVQQCSTGSSTAGAAHCTPNTQRLRNNTPLGNPPTAMSQAHKPRTLHRTTQVEPWCAACNRLQESSPAHTCQRTHVSAQVGTLGKEVSHTPLTPPKQMQQSAAA